MNSSIKQNTEQHFTLPPPFPGDPPSWNHQQGSGPLALSHPELSRPTVPARLPALCCLLPNSSKPLSLFNISSSPRPNPGTYCTNPIPWTKCNCERCMGVKVAEKQSLEGIGEAWTRFMRRDPITTGWVGTLSWSFLFCPREDMLWLKEKC